MQATRAARRSPTRSSPRSEHRAIQARTWLLLAASLLALACAPPTLESQLRACGFISEGELPRLPLYAPNDCYRDCLASASCAALEGALCRTELDLLVACDARCAFECDGGALIAVENVCNGFDDCEGGEDEQGCPTYVCDDGQELVGEHRCDGSNRCSDGSDERDCPTGDEIHCDGRTYPAHVRCNGWPVCADERDEEGCAEALLDCSDG